MTTETTAGTKAATTAPAAHHAPTPGSLDDLICYFEGDFVAMRDAKVNIMTHAFMYGTATFEGIRGYWNAEQGQLYGLKLREHVERIRQSCRILMIDDVPSVDELTGLITATALVRPTKSVHEVDAKSVRKKMKDKAFARGVSREDVVNGAQELGVDLDEHIAFVISAMQARSAELGLSGV